MKANGTAIKYGDNVDTDVIIPARYLNSSDEKELASHCMEDLDKTFVTRVKQGDIILAGKNFGCGSSREHAPIAIKASGVSCVIAQTFARIFYRNAINIGLPILELAETGEISEDKMGGKLSSQETLIASIFRKDFKRCVVQVDDPFAPGYHVDVMLRLENAPPQIKVGFEAGKAKIDVKLDFICGLNNIPSGVSYEKEEYKKELEKVIAAAMLGKIQGMLEKCRSMGADLVGFGYNARGQFKTYPEFMAVKWDELYSQAEIDVKVAVKVKNSGLMRTATSF